MITSPHRSYSTSREFAGCQAQHAGALKVHNTSSRITHHASHVTQHRHATEITTRAAFSSIRYAQVWEDADVLLAGLDVQPGETCLSIASAGDNTLALLAKKPARVIALDLNPAQLFCLELRVAAYRALDHEQLLELMGSRPSTQRLVHYQRCRPLLSSAAQQFWDRLQPAMAEYGIGGVGKFERYFRLFRQWVLPLVHDRATVARLLQPPCTEAQGVAERTAFYEQTWNTWRWRLLVRLFFSQTMMGKLGRDPAFFTYVEGDFAGHVTAQIRRGLCALEPATNPYLHWILTGTHGAALPFALREENFERIRNHLDRLEWHLLPVEASVEQCRADGVRIDKFNLSNIFEYMSPTNYQVALDGLLRVGRVGSRLLYWNMMVPRACPAALYDRLQPLRALADQLHRVDKAMFYSALQIEQMV